MWREHGDKLVDVTAQEVVLANADARCAGLKQVAGVERAQSLVAFRVIGHHCDDADSQSQFNVSLDDSGVNRGQDDFRCESFSGKGLVDFGAAGKRKIICDDRIAGDVLQCELFRP